MYYHNYYYQTIFIIFKLYLLHKGNQGYLTDKQQVNKYIQSLKKLHLLLLECVLLTDMTVGS